MENLVTAENVPERFPFVRRFSIPGVAALVFFAALWLGLWGQLSSEWSVNDQYSYGWFVPFFAIVLFWLRWEDKPKPESGKRKAESGKEKIIRDWNCNRRAGFAFSDSAF